MILVNHFTASCLGIIDMYILNYVIMMVADGLPGAK